MTDWTDELEQKLRDLHATGKSFGHMTEDFPGFTRNALIGKAMRLGLSRRGPSQPRPKQEQFRPRVRYAFHQIRTTRKPPTIPEPPLEISSNPVTLMGLTETTCRWPFGDPLLAGFHFCGDDTYGSLPYCYHHCGMAYERPRSISEAAQERLVRRFTHSTQPVKSAPPLMPEDFAA